MKCRLIRFIVACSYASLTASVVIAQNANNARPWVQPEPRAQEADSAAAAQNALVSVFQALANSGGKPTGDPGDTVRRIFESYLRSRPFGHAGAHSVPEELQLSDVALADFRTTEAFIAEDLPCSPSAKNAVDAVLQVSLVETLEGAAIGYSARCHDVESLAKAVQSHPRGQTVVRALEALSRFPARPAIDISALCTDFRASVRNAAGQLFGATCPSFPPSDRALKRKLILKTASSWGPSCGGTKSGFGKVFEYTPTSGSATHYRGFARVDSEESWEFVSLLGEPHSLRRSPSHTTPYAPSEFQDGRIFERRELPFVELANSLIDGDDQAMLENPPDLGEGDGVERQFGYSYPVLAVDVARGAVLSAMEVELGKSFNDPPGKEYGEPKPAPAGLPIDEAQLTDLLFRGVTRALRFDDPRISSARICAGRGLLSAMQMVDAFGRRLDSEKAQAIGRSIVAAHARFPGAVEIYNLTEQLAEPKSRLEEFGLPSSLLWRDMKDKMSHEEILRYLIDRLPFSRVVSSGCPGMGCDRACIPLSYNLKTGNGCPELLPGPKADAAACVASTVINPYVELEASVSDPKDLQLLLPALADPRFILSNTGLTGEQWITGSTPRRRFGLARVKELAARIVSLKTLAVKIPAEFFENDRTAEKQVVDGLSHWLTAHQSSSEADVLVEVAKGSSEAARFQALWAQLAKRGDPRSFDLLVDCTKRFPNLSDWQAKRLFLSKDARALALLKPKLNFHSDGAGLVSSQSFFAALAVIRDSSNAAERTSAASAIRLWYRQHQQAYSPGLMLGSPDDFVPPGIAAMAQMTSPEAKQLACEMFGSIPQPRNALLFLAVGLSRNGCGAATDDVLKAKNAPFSTGTCKWADGGWMHSAARASEVLEQEEINLDCVVNSLDRGDPRMGSDRGACF